MSPTYTASPARRHPALGVIRVRGADARTFLQGQLSADLAALSPTRALLGCCNSPQGRVQAVLWIIERREELALLLPLQMTALTAARLARYVLRAKVAIDPSPPLSVAMLPPDAAPAGVSLAQPGAHQEQDGISYLRLPGHPALVLLSAQALSPQPPPLRKRGVWGV